MNELLRKSGETDFEYKLRLSLLKLNRETDLEWSEIVELLGLNGHYDNLRKSAYGMKETHEYYQMKIKKGFTDSEMLKEIEDKTIELEKTKVQNRDQKRELSKIVRDMARAEYIYELIEEGAKEISISKPLLPNKNSYDYDVDREGIALFSDWHTGLFVDNYWNEFDKTELVKRVNRLVDKIIEHGHSNKIHTLHVFLLGDLINGLIHVTTRINNTEDTVKQTQILSELLAEVLTRLADEFELVKVYNVLGNHDRVTANKKDEISTESFANFIPWYLKARLSNIKNVEIMENEYDHEIIVADICGYKVFGCHGHRDKITDVVQNLTLMLKEFPSMVCMGHYHHNAESEVHGVDIVINSSLSGVDEFAKEIRRTSKPSQKLIVMDRHEARLCTYSIKLDIK